MNFVIWTVAGGLFGWRVGRWHPAASGGSALGGALGSALGILGAEIGGLLWFPAFKVQPGNYVFDFLVFNVFAALCGAAPLLWVADLVRDRRRRGERLSAPASSSSAG